MPDKDTDRLVPEPPSHPLSLNTLTLPAGAELHRIYRAPYGPAQFNPGGGRRTRFAPIQSIAGTIVPSMYAAASFHGALYESVFHGITAASFGRYIPYEALLNRFHAHLSTRRDLTLAKLFTPDLKKLGLERVQLIDTNSSQYAYTAAWAQQIHHQDNRIDGLIWTSRQNDEERAIVLFGDRVRSDDLAIVSAQNPLWGQTQAYAEIIQCGDRLGVQIGAQDPPAPSEADLE